MIFLKALVLSLLPLAALGAKKSAGDTFQVFHSKSLAAPVKLQDATYDQLTTAPRNHSAAILLTALEAKYGCQLCREFQGEWDILARSWTKGDKQGASRLVYGTLDFADGRGTFQSVSSTIIMTKGNPVDYPPAWTADCAGNSTFPSDRWPPRSCGHQPFAV